MSEYRLMDTSVLDNIIEYRATLESNQSRIMADYKSAIDRLMANWIGRGADAFEKDAAKVRLNLGQVFDAVNNFCNKLVDVQDTVEKLSASLKAAAEEAISSSDNSPDNQ